MIVGPKAIDDRVRDILSVLLDCDGMDNASVGRERSVVRLKN